MIDSGADIEFSVNGKRYVILPWTDMGVIVGMHGTDDDSVFQNADAVIDGYIIDGKPLAAWLDVLRINFNG